MAYNKTLREIFTSPEWMMEGVALAHYMSVVSANIEARIPLEQLVIDAKNENGLLGFTNKGRRLFAACTSDNALAKEQGMAVFAGANSVSILNSSCNEEGESCLEANEEVVKTVLVLHAEGPITRGGDGCSYGSIDHRNLMMEAAEDADCVGVLFHVNTPGGNAMCLPDYKMGFEALRDNGKRSIALVDGMADSLGIVITSQCDYTLVINQDCELGCIGAMANICVTPDGAINSIDGSRHISIVAEQSPDKNRSIMEAAKGNYKLLQQECNETCQDFLDIIDNNRPAILPEHRTGNTYKASEVMGSLCDGIGTEADCYAYLVDGIVPSASAATVPGASASASTTVPDDSSSVSASSTPKTNNTMNIQNICNAIGINTEDMHVEENGFFLNEAHVDTIDAALATAAENEAALATANEQLAAANTQNEALSNSVADAQAALATANEQLTTANARIAELEQTATATATDHEAALATVNEQLTAANAQNEALSNSVADAQAALATANEQLATANARIAELEAENNALAGTTAPANKPAPAAVQASQEGATAKKAYRDCETLDEKKANSIYA